MKRAAIVLAAGLARRMSGPNKLLLPFRRKPMVRWAVDAACRSSAERVVLVTGRDGDEVAEAAGQHRKLVRVHNSAPERGLAASLRLGLAGLPDAEAVAVLLGDMPLINASILEELFWRGSDNPYAVVPMCDGQMGNPVILSAEAVSDCMALEGDAGARKLIEARKSDVMFAEVDTRAILADVDTAPDMDALS